MGHFDLEAVVKDSLITQADVGLTSIIRAISSTKPAVEIALLVKSDPELTHLAEITQKRGSRVDVKSYL